MSPIANSLMRQRCRRSGNELPCGADHRDEIRPRLSERPAHCARDRKLAAAQLRERRRQRAVRAVLAKQSSVAAQACDGRINVLMRAEQVLKRFAPLRRLLEYWVGLREELELVSQALRFNA